MNQNESVSIPHRQCKTDNVEPDDIIEYRVNSS